MTKHAFAPFLISPVKDRDSIKVFAISDKYESVHAAVEIMLIDFDGNILKQDRKQVVLAENSSMQVFGINEADWVNEITRKNVVLSMRLLVNDVAVSSNKYYFEKPKFLNLPKVKIGIKQISENEIELTTGKLARSIWLLLPGTINAFSDNYFDLLPGEKRIVQVKSNDLKKLVRQIQVKSLSDAY